MSVSILLAVDHHPAPQPRPASPDARPSVWSLNYTCLLAATAFVWALVAYYVWFIRPFVALPADILMWAETNFVGDIIKIRTGQPIYTPPADNNSFIYTPAAPLVTYAIAWVAGYPTSIPAWRVIQLGFVAVAAVLATVCCRLVYDLVYPDRRLPFPRTWLVLWAGVLVLAVTSPEVNRYVHCLHADALALLVSVATFLTAVLYLRSPRWTYLALLAVCPALGYLTKQFLVSWVAVLAAFLVLHRPRDWRRYAVFLAGAVAGIAAAVGICYLLWGESYVFWTFEVMGGERKRIALSPDSPRFSVARMADHVLQSWFELSLGVVGGWLLLRGDSVRRLGPLWVAWAALVASEVFSSGAGWGVLYHFGPGVVIGAVWLLAALPRYWHWPTPVASPWPGPWARGVYGTVAIVTVCVALRAVPAGGTASPRSWARRPTADLDRYIASIEHEFEGLPPDQVLLDVGNWVYLPHDVLMRDRAVSTADQPPGGRYENLDVARERFRARAYAKVLVRNFHSPRFLYDYSLWPRPSGVRAVLLEHYTEVRTIPAAEGPLTLTPGVKHTGPVSVFVPKESADRR